MLFGVVSIFPEIFDSFIRCGSVKKAIDKKKIDISFWNPRDYSIKNRVDSRPYGGGSGMVMMPEPLFKAIDSAKTKLNKNGKSCKIIHFSPQGKKINQSDINDLILKDQNVIFIAGRYSGIDERLFDVVVSEEWSLGDFVLNGGEVPSMLVLESISRSINGVLSNREGILKSDSFYDGMLCYPNYTKPRTFMNRKIPLVLLSGNHMNIDRWRLKHRIGRTWIKRRDLFNDIKFDEDKKKIINEFILEMGYCDEKYCL